MIRELMTLLRSEKKLGLRQQLIFILTMNVIVGDQNKSCDFFSVSYNQGRMKHQEKSMRGKFIPIVTSWFSHCSGLH